MDPVQNHWTYKDPDLNYIDTYYFDCGASCVVTCGDVLYGCVASCVATCADDCTGSCVGSCVGYCQGTCEGSCYGGCYGTCLGTATFGGGGGGGGASGSGGSGGGVLFKAVKIDCTSGSIDVLGGDAAEAAVGGAGGYNNGHTGYTGEQGGGGGGGRIKMFYAQPASVNYVAPAVDYDGGLGKVNGSPGTYATLAVSDRPLQGRMIYQEGGAYLKRVRVKLLD